MKVKCLSTTCAFGPDQSTRLDRVVQQLTGLSRAGVRGLLDHDCVRLNNEPIAEPHALVRTGDVIEIRYDPDRRYKEKSKAKPDPAYRVLFEDDHLVVVDKAAHVITVPSPRGAKTTLAEALERNLNRGRKPNQRGYRRVHVVHRLDRGTSGVLVFAKTSEAAARLKEQFAARKPRREYLAVVAGHVKENRGTFRSHLATDWSLNRFSTQRPGKGQLAITHFKVERRFGSAPKGNAATLVRVRLETGRRNQIRVHFAEAGHPVLGDPRYPRATAQDTRAGAPPHPRWIGRSLALHAESLAFDHPMSGQPLRFHVPAPKEFQPFMAR